MPLPLTPPLLDAARRYLQKLGDKAWARAEDHLRADRIADLEPYRRGIGFRALVAETCETKVRWVEAEWEGECSCDEYLDCDHCGATLLAGILQSGAALPERPLDGTGRGDAPEEPEADASFTATDSFAEILGAKLGRPLTGAERRAAQAVDDIFTHDRHSEVVAEAKLRPLLRAGAAALNEGADLATFWPVEPANRWDTWLYVAGYLRARKMEPLPALAEVTDWSEVDRLVSSFSRRDQIEHWREWLQKTAAPRNRQEARDIALRVRLTEEHAQLEWRRSPKGEFTAIKPPTFTQLQSDCYAGRIPFDEQSLPVWRAFDTGYGAEPLLPFTKPDCARVLNVVLRLPALPELAVGPRGEPLRFAPEQLQWRVQPAGGERADYEFALVRPDGSAPPPPLTVLDGEPSLYVTAETIYPGPPLGALPITAGPISIPHEAIESNEGVALLDRLAIEPPAALAQRIRKVTARVIIRCVLEKIPFSSGEAVVLTARAEHDQGGVVEAYTTDGWQALAGSAPDPGAIVRFDRSALDAVPDLVSELRLAWQPHDQRWSRKIGKQFPEQFAEWLSALPPEIETDLDSVLESLRDAPLRATVKIEIEEAGIDWFDLKLALDVADTTLTKADVRLLLDARGAFVRLGAKGWRRLTVELSAEDEEQLADLGLNARELPKDSQRLHALQLAGKSAARRLLPAEQADALDRRAQEIQTQVAPPVPTTLLAELRPYQTAGFQFLAYLTANHFGGILADDMGLGKTVQALAWLLWLREGGDPSAESKTTAKAPKPRPTLVVCPKSVTDNWLAESSRFAPSLRVHLLDRSAPRAMALKTACADADIVVLNYAQLRILDKELIATPWLAVILDEAQSIKNPDSQTARAAFALKTSHRLALSGTPIENRLLDLWSIMAFAMPGVLGRRADFSRNFDQRSDPFARRRVAARVRPFVLRRTKSEVAKDLPERIEEDLHCEFEGTQAQLYKAELKRARAALLHIQTATQLDKARFNILTSLLRLRQICCHPALVSEKAADAESAKMTALFDLLEPLMEEGHKVLVFSQFVEMLTLIRAEVMRREWPNFLLTGATENRGALVADFQGKQGSAVFLISLRAGGFGLNLTAASYVVLFDPWWNPAVENQAIDRTHRIGQRSTVMAYRLLVKDTIEEKIRALQKQKHALATDILGEENFARALSLDDFRFLLGE